MNFLLYWFVRGIIAFFSILPIELVGRIGRAFGAATYIFDRRHRSVTEQNLQSAYAGEKSESEIKDIAREHFKRLGENYCCAIKTAFMSEAEVKQRLEVTGVEKLGPATALGENLMIAIGHFGNFEVYARTRFSVEGYSFATTYRALRNESLTRLMQYLRTKSGIMFFERRTEADALKLALKKGRLMLGLLADQHAGKHGLWVPFFGRECSTTPAPAILALRYDARLFTAICYRVSLARWRIEVGDEIPVRSEAGVPRSSIEIMRDVNHALETAVRRDPANWFWVHKRWKPVSPQKQKSEPVEVDDPI